MFLLNNGIQLQHASGDYRMGVIPVARVHITAPPALKTAFHARTGGDLLEEIKCAIQSIPVIMHAHISNRAVRLRVQRLEHLHPDYHHHLNESMRQITNELISRSAAWQYPRQQANHVPPTGCQALQNIILNKLQDDYGFKLSCCINHAAMHGSHSTWDMLRLADEWRLEST